MKQNIRILLIIFLAVFTSCTSKANLPEYCSKKSLAAHPQFTFNDQIAGFGWQPGSTITLEIDDPATGEGADYTDSQVAALTDVECATVNFLTGDAWDLRPEHIVILSDGKTTSRHIVQDLGIDGIDIEANTFSGWAKPGSEMMVWVEAPYEHELRVTADTNGHWFVDFTGTTDIIESSIGAVAQNDDPNSDSHTRINWNFGRFHLEASLVDDQIGFYNFHPFNSLTYQIYQSENGDLLLEETLETDELGHAYFENQNRLIDLVQGNFIVAQNDATGQEISLEMGYLTLGTVDFKTNTLSGQAEANVTVWIYAYDLLTEAEHSMEVVSNAEGEWFAEFDADLHMDMELYARVFDEEGDETAVRWIPEQTE